MMTDNIKKMERPRALNVINFRDFKGRPIPDRRWIVPGILIEGGITLMNGDGGMGKSLLCLQLQIAAALGQPWVGIPVAAEGPLSTFGFYCEDDVDELQRRAHDVLEHYGATWDDLEDRVLAVSRIGLDNTLMNFDRRNDKGTVTATFQQLEEIVRARGVQLAIIDTVADTFAGNENIRPQVRAFVNAMRNLATANHGGVIMTAHPSRAGLSDGSGLSGSTGWNGSVRSRVYFTRPKSQDKDIDGEEEPTDERLLKIMKSNYSRAGEKLRMKWEKGVFVRIDLATSTSSMFDRLDDDRHLYAAAEYLVRQLGVQLSADPSPSGSLVNRARKLPSCRHMSFKAASAAQDRLLSSGKLVTVEMGPKSKRRLYIRPAHARLPGEDDGGTIVHPVNGAHHDEDGVVHD